MSKSYRSDPRNHIGRTLEIIQDIRGWISADGFSDSASIQQRTSRNKLPKIVILFDEQNTFSKTLCKQAFQPIISFARKYYGTLSICSHLPIFSRLTCQYCSIITLSLGTSTLETSTLEKSKLGKSQLGKITAWKNHSLEKSQLHKSQLHKSQLDKAQLEKVTT